MHIFKWNSTFRNNETVALIFLDNNLTIDTKIQMVRAIKLNNLNFEINKRLNVSSNEVIQFVKKEINDFIYIESTSFFFLFFCGFEY